MLVDSVGFSLKCILLISVPPNIFTVRWIAAEMSWVEASELNHMQLRFPLRRRIQCNNTSEMERVFLIVLICMYIHCVSKKSYAFLDAV